MSTVRTSCILCIGLAAIWGSWAAHAQDTRLTPREEQLLKTVQQLEHRLADLEQQVKALKEAQAPDAAQAAPAPAAEKAPEDALEQRVTRLEEDKKDGFKTYWKNGLRFDSPDGNFKLQVGGRVVYEWAGFHQDDELRNSLGDEQDGVQFRTARINLAGTIYKDIFYRLEYDLAGNNGPNGFTDTYLGIQNVPYAGTLTFGHFKEPFGLEELTGDTYITFAERALPSTFTPSRNAGAMANNAHFGERNKERLTWAAGVFKETDNWPSVNDSDEDRGYAATARVTGLPWYADDGARLLHLGLAYSHRNPDGATVNRYQLQPYPESRLALFRWADTEGFKPFRLQDARADDVNLWGAETALVYGPFSLQGEYMRSDVDTTFGGRLAFDGYYVQASYFLTGEHRIYKNALGYFDRVAPKNNFNWGKGAGAWELALRYSTVDLNDGGVRGGEESNYTAGLNWYLNPNTRLTLNYIIADMDHDLYEGKLEILQARFQVDF